MQWYYAVNGQQRGPVEEDALFELGRNGELRGDDLVWNAALGDQWVKASTIAGLIGAQTPPTAAAWDGTASFVSRTHNRDLMAQARACLQDRWGLAIAVIVINFALGLACGSIPIAGALASLVITGPLSLGVALFFLSIARGGKAALGMMFDGFQQFGNAVGAYLLMILFTLLWTLLLIIPGILASLSYSMTFYIIADNPSVGVMEAIDRSKQMMYGNRWKYFCLQWRFFWWSLLCLLTCGIGYLWLAPYIVTSNTRFYDDLRTGRA